MTMPVVAIDGPAASGKSSTASMVAARLGLIHVDSGALYRALTWLAVRDDLQDEHAICRAAEAADLTLVADGSTLTLRAGGEPIEAAIRSPEVTSEVSRVAALPAVRGWVNGRLRAAVAGAGGGVMDGRDIGTVVFPDAVLKVFLTASPEARARRRLLQDGQEPGQEAIAAEAARLAARDRLDAGRAVAPLRQAPDALLLDTSTLDFGTQVARIVGWAGERGLLPV
ncbi:MAG: (d)CMP kinase [Gemmatimonadales bacterium]|nr:(d)CMP kinase [Gemmatimonadota bacterium]MBP6442499.1 (d)CMP kinase [Gemmatimonadales bacterium]MBP6569785.1 (d)CMP kinase [Gemmatimonadales bacterium]MBP7621000.1 (d)CMP kinase [Gemmatimonadales bacterium]MBP9896732.1 (d)CMP kinase [Gemmatimonadales bacterium]